VTHTHIHTRTHFMGKVQSY